MVSQNAERSKDGLYLEELRLGPGCMPFDHHFKAGEITVVLGGNNSGKTDLCRFVAGLAGYATAHGMVLNGTDLLGVKTGQRSVGYVYQAFVNYPNLTVAENIASPMVARGLVKGERTQQVEAIATQLRLADLLQRYPHELSGGQQQRVAIARALAKQAQVLLLDEPLVNLDFKLREALELELREILQQNNVVVIYTSSDQRDAYTLADEVLLMQAGSKLACGKPLELYQRPGKLAVMELMSDPQVNTWTQNDCLYALRPEHLRLIGDAEDAELVFELEVQGVETDGRQSLLFGRRQWDSEEAEHNVEDTWVIRSEGISAIQVGSKIRVGARSTDVVEFQFHGPH